MLRRRSVVPLVASALLIAGLPATAASAGPPPRPRAGAPASGSDASCPTHDPGGAPGAPTLVHAIPADGTATVLWCPPATGAGQITGYTVTASTGQQVTAKAPNDWAIVSGLSDGSA